MAVALEKLSADHRRPVIDIFNHYVEHSIAAYPEQAVPYEMFDLFLGFAKTHPAVVAQDDEGEVIGFALLRPFHIMPTFRRTAQVTYFIAPGHTGRGLGRSFLDHLETEAKKMGVDSLLADISSHNHGSINFHRRNGFQECGRFQKIGRKFDQDFDQVWMQKHLP